MTRNKRLLLGGVAATVLVVVAALVTAVFAAEPIARSLVRSAAHEHGVQVDSEHIDLGWGWVRLREATFGLEGVPGIRATVERATVDLNGLSPTRVEMRGVSVRITGSAARFVVDLGRWAKLHPEAVQFPLTADRVSVAWREDSAQAPWLRLDGGFVVPRTGGSRLSADEATVLDVSVGPVGAVWASDSASVTFGFGDPDPAAALARMDVDPKTSTAKLVLRPVELSALARPLGVQLPIDEDVILEGDAKLLLEASEVTGSLRAKLRGYVPPHPKELDGIVFGDETTFDSDFRVTPDRGKVFLEKSRVSAGAFVLDGEGSIERAGDHAMIAMHMAGDIPCTSLAKSAAVSRLGGALGQLLGDAATRTLAGSVRVGVKVLADSRKLDEAKVSHDVSIGCTLRFR